MTSLIFGRTPLLAILNNSVNNQAILPSTTALRCEKLASINPVTCAASYNIQRREYIQGNIQRQRCKYIKDNIKKLMREYIKDNMQRHARAKTILSKSKLPQISIPIYNTLGALFQVTSWHLQKAMNFEKSPVPPHFVMAFSIACDLFLGFSKTHKTYSDLCSRLMFKTCVQEFV